MSPARFRLFLSQARSIEQRDIHFVLVRDGDAMTVHEENLIGDHDDVSTVNVSDVCGGDISDHANGGGDGESANGIASECPDLNDDFEVGGLKHPSKALELLHPMKLVPRSQLRRDLLANEVKQSSSLSLFLCLSAYLPICFYVYQAASISLLLCFSVYLSISASPCVSVSLMAS